jgi:hypothetical protein
VAMLPKPHDDRGASHFRSYELLEVTKLMHIVESCGLQLPDEHMQCDSFSCSARG